MIKLTNKDFLAQGCERRCYIHPNDSTKVIKIVYKKEIHNNQNYLEYKYIKHLKLKKKDLSHITNCYGFIETNFGKGLVFDRVLDYNLKGSISFREYLINKTFSYEKEQELLSELKNYLHRNNILFIDVNLVNLFCQEFKENEFKLIIIDGLGGRRLNWRFKLYLKSTIFTSYKVKKQWKKLYANYLLFSKYKN